MNKEEIDSNALLAAAAKMLKENESKTNQLVDFYFRERNELYRLAIAIASRLRLENKDCGVKAPVKSGKRILTQIMALLALPTEALYYLSAFYQTSMDPDLEEISEHGVNIALLNRKENINALIEDIKNTLRVKNLDPIITFDECDHGTGINSIYHTFRQELDKALTEEEKKRVRHVYVSATPEELLHSQLNSPEKLFIVEFIPPANYFGAKRFLENSLVKGEIELLQYNRTINEWVLSDELVKVLVEYMNSPDHKTVTFIRGAKKRKYKGRKVYEHTIIKESQIIQNQLKALYEAFKKEPDIEFIDSEEKSKVDWREKSKIISLLKDKKIIFLNQMAKRSTNLECHKNIYALIESRNFKSSNLATLKQSIFRIVHYVPQVGISYQILVYAPLAVFRQEAGELSLSEYQKSVKGGKISSRVKRTKNVYTLNSPKDIFVCDKREEIVEIAKKYVTIEKMIMGENVVVNAMSKNIARDFAREILDGKPTDVPIYIDGPSKSFLESYDELIKKYPSYKGKYYYKKKGEKLEYQFQTHGSVYSDKKAVG